MGRWGGGQAIAWRHNNDTEQYMEEAVTLTFCYENMVSDIYYCWKKDARSRTEIFNCESLGSSAVPRKNTQRNAMQGIGKTTPVSIVI